MQVVARRALAVLIPMLLSAAVTWAGEATVYGAALTDAQVVPVQELVQHPDAYVGKTIRVEGTIRDVCPMAGCWIDIAAKDQAIRFKVTDGEIVFPVSAKGHGVVAEGVLVKQEMSREQAVAHMKHLAEEKGEPFDPASVTGPRTTYQIQGKGAVVR